MNKAITLAALLLAAAGAHAQNPPAPPAIPGAPAAPAAPGGELEQRLEAARERLEAAAREVAELSAQLGGPIADRLLLRGPEHRRAIIGVRIDPASGGDGARVQEVSPGGPAEEAGVRAGDVIVAIDGAELEGRDDSARELLRRMRDVDPDAKVKLRVLRDGKPREFEVRARARSMPFPGAAADGPMPFEHELPWGMFEHLRGGIAGMELASLTPKLGQYFGAETGILVVRAPQSRDLALEDGDVILSIDGREPTSGAHAMRILRSYQPGEKVTLRIMRQRKAMTLQGRLPERSEERRARALSGGGRIT